MITRRKQKLIRDSESLKIGETRSQKILTKMIPEYKGELDFDDLGFRYSLTDQKQTQILTFNGYGEDHLIGNFMLKRLGKVLKSHRMLKELRVNCTNCIFSAIGVRYLGEAIKNLKSLKKVQFIFIDCYRLSHHGIYSLVRSLKSLSSLKSLQIDFLYENQTEPKGAIRPWAQKLKAMRSLTDLRFDLAE